MEASRAFRFDSDHDPTLTPQHDRHALHSLTELASALARARDVHGVVDALLLNLMGHLGTARTAVCLGESDCEEPPVPIRCHGISRPLMTVVLASAWPELAGRLRASGAALRFSTLTTEEVASLTFAPLGRQAGVELIVPLQADRALLGVLVLGWRVGGKPYGPLDLELIDASAAMAAMALKNAELQGVASDVGRRQRAALEDLAELDRMKSQLVDNLSHELQTPVAIMQASLECLDLLALENPQAGTLIRAARSGATNLGRVIKQLLTFSEGARRELQVKLVERDLVAIVAGVVEERRPGVSAGRRELRFDAPATPLAARFDPARLSQVLDELIDNAVKFTPPGSAIRISLGDHLDAGVTWRKIEVRDNGPGIAEEQLPHLFTEFRQVDGSATRMVGGLGLGLAVARKLVEAMGGRISVSSAPSPGATFTILLARPL